MCRNTTMANSGGAACASTPNAAELKHPRQSLVLCQATEEQGTASFSSSLLCLGGNKNNNSSQSPGGSATVATDSDDRKKNKLYSSRGNKPNSAHLLDMQQRLRMTPSALWGERANLADKTEQQYQAMANGEVEGNSATALTSPAVALNQPPQRGSDSLGEVGEQKREWTGRESSAAGEKEKHARVEADKSTIGAVGCGERTSATGLVASTLSKDNGDESANPLAVGETSVYAASLKIPVVTSTVPLRWQSRVVTLSSLQDHGGGGPPRNGSPASGKRRVRTKPRLNQRSTKKRSRRVVSIHGRRAAGGVTPYVSQALHLKSSYLTQ